ncbi:anti-sigma B factor antagonist [Marmoricola sp. OAE513]|uniref:STAS domain-containing protein n=1 Tax=Marmoricola sp. OAE513 TaxID=2817894 RepID=UPI001AE6B9E0
MTLAPHIERTEDDGVVVLTPVGDFDLSSAEILSTAFGGALADHDRIVLDLAQTTFVDSTALGEFVSASQRATRAGGWLRLAGARPHVRKLLRITALDTVLGLYDSVAEARTASPAEHRHDDELADEMSAESFPGSDPPSTWAGVDEPHR